MRFVRGAASPPARERPPRRRRAATTSGIPPTRAASRRCASPGARSPRRPGLADSGRSHGTTPPLSDWSRWNRSPGRASGGGHGGAWWWRVAAAVRGGRGGADRGVRRRCPRGRYRRHVAGLGRGRRRMPGTASQDQTTAGAAADRTAPPSAATTAEIEAQYLQTVRDVSWKVRGQLESFFEEGLALRRPRPLELGQAGRPHFRAAPVAHPHRAAGRARRARGRSRRRTPSRPITPSCGTTTPRPSISARSARGPGRGGIGAPSCWPRSSCSAWSESAPPG